MSSLFFDQAEKSDVPRSGKFICDPLTKEVVTEAEYRRREAERKENKPRLKSPFDDDRPVQRGKWIYDTALGKCVDYASRPLPELHGVVDDTMPPTYNHLTCKTYTSRSQYTRDTLAAGGRIVGNDFKNNMPKPKEITPDKRDTRADLQKVIPVVSDKRLKEIYGLN